MIWLNVTIILVSILALIWYGFTLYRNSMRPTIGRVQRTIERFTLRADTIQGIVGEIQQHIAGTQSAVGGVQTKVERVKQEGGRLKEAATAFTAEVGEFRKEIKALKEEL